MRFATLSAMTLYWFACSAAAQSACEANEKTVWSCRNPTSSYAACASADLSKNAGYLQYRAIRNGKSVLEFPSPRAHPAGLFKFSLLARGATLSFENGGYMYEMYEGLQGAPYILVSKAGKRVSKVECADSDETLTLTETIDRLKAAGLSE